MTTLSPETWLVTGGRPEEVGSPLNVPLVPSSNFLIGGERQYSREDSTPTWAALEKLIGELEGGESVAFSSGMAATAAVFDQVPLGAGIALPDDVYHGVTRLAEIGQEQGRWNVRRIKVADTQGWQDALLNCDLVWLESPSNPLLVLADLKAICSAPKKAGAMLVIDNTVATPLNQQPLELGADVSMQSATKLIGGHSDLLMGMLASRNPELSDRFRLSRKINGATPGALEAFLAVRGLRTLALRLERAQSNAMTLARFLEQQPLIQNVRYPGLERHPQHRLARSQMNGFGTLISFEVRGGAEVAIRLCQNTRLVRHATSLGAVESTMERRGAQPGQEHLPPGFIRLSVGIEAAGDLQADLEQAIGVSG